MIDDPNIKRVELFAGDQCSSDCPRGTVPPGLPPMAVDDAYLVIDPQPFTVLEKDFSDGVAGFRIESSQDAALPILVIVAYDAQDQIRWSWSKHWVDIPDADSERWRIRLDPTTAITATFEPQPPWTERIAMWTDPMGRPSCLLLEHWSDRPAPTRELVGPKDNPDCDNVTAVNECAPWIPNAVAATPTIDQASCVLHGLTAAGLDICQLGGPECSENSALPRNLCVPLDETYCTPTAFCQCTTADVLACVRAVVTEGTNNSTIPYVKCVIRVDASGNRCDSGTPLELDLSPFVNTGSSSTCKDIDLSDGDPLAPFDSSLQVGGAKLYIESVTGCKATAKWENGMAPPLSFGLIEAELTNGYHLVAPIRVEIKPGCDIGGSTCGAFRPNTTGESLFNCAAAAPTGTACAPDGSCSEGPECNGECCGVGEACTPNGCSCGGGPRCGQGDFCSRGGPAGDDFCGTVCCGASGPCPLNP